MSKNSKHRKITYFMGQEMIFDYLSGSMNEDCKEHFEDFLKKNDDFREEVESVTNGVSYLDKLSKTEINESVFSYVKEKITISKLLKKKLNLTKRSSPFKWVVEAILVSVTLSTLFLVIPWGNLFKNPKIKSLILLEKNIKTKKIEEKLNEKLIKPLKSLNQAELQLNQNYINKLKISKIEIPSDLGKKEAVILKKVNKKIKISKIESPVKLVKKEKLKKAEKVLKKLQSHGVLYRLNMEVENIDKATESITEKIKALGGKKAGRVKLGWKKSNGTSYFHLILPDNRMNQFKLFIKKYGKIKINKLVHPRIMSKGSLRMIILVKQGKENILKPVQDLEIKNSNSNSNSNSKSIDISKPTTNLKIEASPESKLENIDMKK